MVRVITKIRNTKKNICLDFDNHEHLIISENALMSSYLYVGKSLSEKEYKEIVRLTEMDELFLYAMNLLKHGHLSENKMREKLINKKDDNKTINRIIEILKQNDLINDYCLMLDIYEYGNERNLGKNRIINDLKSQGIFDVTLKKLKFSDSLELTKAKNQLERLDRKYSKYSNQSKRHHIYNALLSLGFDVEIAIKVSEMASKSNDEMEFEKLKKDYTKVHVKLSKQYDGYELKKKVIQSLKQKGYKSKDITKLMEDKNDENDF